MKLLSKCFILISFFTLALMGCQNKSSSLTDPSSSAYSVDGVPMSTPTPAMSEFKLYPSASTVDFRKGAIYQIDLMNDTLTDTTSSSNCSLAQNSNWQKAKQLYLENGICRYAAASSGGVSCLSVPNPVIEVKDLQTQNVFTLSDATCPATVYSICRQNLRADFNKAVNDLQQQISSNTACSP